MANAKVVLTNYVWESLDVEKKILAGLAIVSGLPVRSAKGAEAPP